MTGFVVVANFCTVVETGFMLGDVTDFSFDVVGIEAVDVAGEAVSPAGFDFWVVVLDESGEICVMLLVSVDFAV